MEERRKYPRIITSLPAECTMINGKDYFYTVTKDISLGGAQLLSGHFIPKDSVLKLALNFIDSLITVKAKVAWCNKKRACERYNLGLEFVEVSPLSQRNITTALNNFS
jgi:c-di-GMP-binding flagellar brake protein YcgR